ncbi:MAG: outer membrane protein assembly factor BamA [Pseudomonadota bacterium]
MTRASIGPAQSRAAHYLPHRQRSVVSTLSLLIAAGGLLCAPLHVSSAHAQQQAGGPGQPPAQGAPPGTPQGVPPGARPGPSPEAAAALQQLLAPKATPVIRGISVAGNQRIEPETVASYLTLQPGMEAEPALLDLQVKTLFQTGLFSDVTVNVQPDQTLLVTVKENPIVNRVLFEGNKRLKEDKFTEEIQLTARSIYTRAKVQADQQRMIETYRATGRFAATVTPKVVPLAQNRVDVIFEIDEGPKTGIAKVNFIGNEVFTSGELRKVILTSESRWWNFFGGSTSNYDPDRLEFERELLRQHYAKNGYADFQVTSLVAELTPDRKEFFVTFTVDEGPKYTVGEVKVRSALDKLDESTVENFVPIRAGQVFNGERVEKAVESLTFLTGASGYAFVDVNPRLTRYPESKTVDITFEINEGPKVYVERINIKGNTATLDRVIRRELRIAEGDPFNKVQVDRSEAVIRSLGFFSDVTIEEKPGSAPDRTELDVTVQEQSTGTFSIGVGVSSTDNFIADVSVEQRNWLGRGEAVRFRVQASQRTRQVDLRYTKPRFLGRNLTAGGSLFYNRIDNTARIRGQDLGLGGFIQEQVGFGLNTGFQVSEFGQAGLSYLFTRSEVDFGRDARITPTFTDPLAGEVPALVDESGNFVNPLTGEIIDPLTDDVFSVPSGLTADDVILAPFGARLDGTPFTSAGEITDNDVAFGATPNPTFVFDDCNPNLDIRQFQCESEGTFTTSLLSASLSFSTLNDPFNPSRGWRARSIVSVAGLGGNVQYARGEFDGAYYKPLPFLNSFIGALKLRGGYITGFAGDTVRIQDRFRQGAQSFRGFDIAGVGPRVLVPTNPTGAGFFDAETLQPATPQQINNAVSALPNGGFDTGNGITFRSQSIGGNAYVVGSAEVLLPLPLPDSYGIRASIFTDFGAVGLVDDETRQLNEQLGILLDVSPTRINGDGTVERLDPDFLTLAAPIQDDFSFRLSAGVTIGWNSPFGPIRFDIAEVFIREFYDEVEAFRFSAGTNF